MKENRGQADLDGRNGSEDDIFENNIGHEGVLQIAACLSHRPDSVDLLLLVSRLYDVLNTYLDGEYAVRYYRLEKEENQAYERVATKAMQLQEALMALNHFGQTNKKLSQGIRECDTQYVRGSDGANLTRILDEHRRALPFFSLCRHLEDLSFVAQSSVNRKPQKPEGGSDLSLGNYERALNKWKAQVDAHRLGKDHPLICLIEGFDTLFEFYPEANFSEGMYHGGSVKRTESRAVDAIEIFVAKLDSTITRQNIVTAMRKHRKRQKEVPQNATQE